MATISSTTAEFEQQFGLASALPNHVNQRIAGPRFEIAGASQPVLGTLLSNSTVAGLRCCNMAATSVKYREARRPITRVMTPVAVEL